MTAVETLIEELRWYYRLSQDMKDQLAQLGDDEFWECWEWLRSLPEPPEEQTLEEYLHRVEPQYWAPEEIREALGEG